jgi:site-specific recombinase XerD
MTHLDPDHELSALGSLAGTGSILLENCPAAVYLAQLKQSSRRPQKQALDLVASLLSSGSADCLTLNWGAVRYQHTAAVRARLLDEYAPATANRILSALRGVLEQAWLLGQMSAEDYHRAARLAPITGETLPAGRELLAEEIASLILNCLEDCSPIGIRDAAIISILFGAGLRREEITTLNLADYHPEEALLVIRGKRSKERAGYLGNGALAALANWLDIRGKDAGPLFVSVKRGGILQHGRKLSPQSIYYLLKMRAKKAGVKPFSPHDLRRTFVSRLLDSGVDIAIVAKMAGHSNIQTTVRYDRRPEDAKRRAANLLHIPYPESEEKSKSIKELASSMRSERSRLGSSGFSSAIIATMEVGNLRFYKDRWKAVEEIEKQELRAMSLEEHWHQLNALARFAIEMGLDQEDDSEMEVFLRWAELKTRYEAG